MLYHQYLLTSKAKYGSYFLSKKTNHFTKSLVISVSERYYFFKIACLSIIQNLRVVLMGGLFFSNYTIERQIQVKRHMGRWLYDGF